MAQAKMSPRRQETNFLTEDDVTRHTSLAEGDGIVQKFVNCDLNIVAGNQIIKHIHVCKDITEPRKNADSNLLETQFLEKVNRHFRKKVNVNQNLPACPTIMVIDMENGKGNTGNNTLFGRDIKRIDIEQVHDAIYDKTPVHVMVLGEAGAGKSTLLKTYSTAVSEGRVQTLCNNKMTHFVDAGTLQNQTLSDAFNMLFVDQMAGDRDTELSSDEESAGRIWLKQKSGETFIAIDGLDQCLEEFGCRRYPEISAIIPAKANDVIANILSRKIWPGVRILTASRWNTYWDLTSEQKPDKTLGLRGLDDENLQNAASNLTTDSDTMLNQLRETSPKLLTLCRNPMFLNYMTKIFHSNRKSLPDSLSGLISAFFRDFLHAYKINNYEEIAKLAYHGMKERKFVFGYRYLRKLAINPNEVLHFLNPGADLDEGHETAISDDKFFVFSHQTMQEFCCTLHVLNLNSDSIKEFVATHLNEGRMELTRQILYGLILDDKVTKPMRKYLTDRKTSIDDCREILYTQLRDLMKNGAICNLQTIKLISECGYDTISRIENSVRRIVINAVGLPENDQIQLVTMVKMLSPLELVWISELELTPSLIQHVKDCHAHVDLFKVGYEITDSVNECHFPEAMEILNASRLLCVNLRCCDDMKLLFLLDWIQKGQIQLDQLGLLNITRIDTIRTLFVFLSNQPLDFLRLNVDPNLFQSQLTEIIISYGAKTRKVNTLVIEDQSLTSEKLRGYLEVFRKCGIRGLSLAKCRLTETDVKLIASVCHSYNIQLQKLIIKDEAMDEAGYEEVSSVINLTDCKEFQLELCGLNKTKLRRLSQGFRKRNATLPELTIVDSTMPPEVYEDVAAIVQITHCKEVCFGRSDLTPDKLEAFAIACRDKQIVISKLFIQESHTTAIDGNISALCDIMTSTVEGLYLYDWKIDANGEKRLKETIQLENSKIKVLRLPNGIFVRKKQSATHPKQ